MQTKHFLQDDKIRLRAVEPSDADVMWEIERDPTQWIDNGMSAPYSRHNLEEYAKTYDADPIRAGQIRLVVDLPTSTEHEVVGLVDLYEISPTGRNAFVGIYIRREFRGKGLAKRALKLLEEYAYILLGLRILGAKIASTNTPSILLFEQCGYTHSGTLTDWLRPGISMEIYTKEDK